MNLESPTDQAARWATRLDAGPLTADEAVGLTHWLDADPANEGRLEEMQRIYQKVRLVLPGMVAERRLGVSKRQRMTRTGWNWAGGLAAALVFIVSTLIQRPTTFSTAAAQRQTVVLKDGTRAELNACTTLRVQMRGAERRVSLEKGEVLFTVSKNLTKPFVVETAAGSVRVTGTVFNVSCQTADSLEVVLLEGSVEATSTAGGTVRRLIPGDQFVISAAGNEVRRLTPDELADALAWREGRIVFRDTPLSQALAQFARHHARVVEVAPDARALTLGGRFVLDDFEEFLRDLAVALPVVVRHGPDGIIRVERRLTEKK